MEKLQLLTPEQLQVLSPEQIRAIINVNDKPTTGIEYNLFFDELSECFKSISDCTFRLGDNKIMSIPTQLSELDHDDNYRVKNEKYIKFSDRINKSFLKITDLVQKNYEYLNNICIMFIPYAINLSKINTTFDEYYNSKYALVSNVSLYDSYGIYKMILVDVNKFSELYNINLNDYVINLLNVKKKDGFDNPLSYIKHSDYVHYEIPASVLIPKKIPEFKGSEYLVCYEPHTILSKFKFIDMILLRKQNNL